MTSSYSRSASTNQRTYTTRYETSGARITSPVRFVESSGYHQRRGGTPSPAFNATSAEVYVSDPSRPDEWRLLSRRPFTRTGTVQWPSTRLRGLDNAVATYPRVYGGPLNTYVSGPFLSSSMSRATTKTSYNTSSSHSQQQQQNRSYSARATPSPFNPLRLLPRSRSVTPSYPDHFAVDNWRPGRNTVARLQLDKLQSGELATVTKTYGNDTLMSRDHAVGGAIRHFGRHCELCRLLEHQIIPNVSRLVILHEEAEDGNAMPDLTKPVYAVSAAVENLIKVGYETCHSSDDHILKQDMPPALDRVEKSSRLLEDACRLLKGDPLSVPARKKLIDGARGILQGTSALLLCFDESEVRKIIRGCKKVLDYLAVAEVIETMEDLVQFVKDISPWLTRVSKDIDGREKELTHQVHREILIRCMDSIKTLAPILICAMKIFIQIHSQRGKGIDEAAENRNYLSQRMMDEINEIIRVLQLTTYDEDEWDADNLTVMKKAISAIESLLQAALDWLADPRALRGGVGEKSIRRILDYSERIADRALPDDANAIRRACADIESMTDALGELRQQRQGDSPQAQGLARGIAQKLKELIGTKDQMGLLQLAIQNMERSGILQPAHTVAGRIEQALRWLENPGVDDRGLGLHAIRLVTEEGRKVAELCKGPEKYRLNQLCDDVDRLAAQLVDLHRKGLGDSPQARAIAGQLRDKLMELKDMMQRALIDRVIDDFSDMNSPLKQLVDAAHAPENMPDREPNFADKSRNLQDHSLRSAHTARLVATSGGCKDKKTVEALCNTASQVASMTPQVINAGKIRLHYPQNKAADEHFENLRREFADALARMRALVDEAIDFMDFIKASEDAVRKHTDQCENAIQGQHPQKMVDNTSQIARVANRVLHRTKNEADNSEDPRFNHQMNSAAHQLQGTIPPMVQDAKQVALSPKEVGNVNRWRDSNQQLRDAIANVRNQLQPEPDISSLNIAEKCLNEMITTSEPVVVVPERSRASLKDDDGYASDSELKVAWSKTEETKVQPPSRRDLVNKHFFENAFRGIDGAGVTMVPTDINNSDHDYESIWQMSSNMTEAEQLKSSRSSTKNDNVTAAVSQSDIDFKSIFNIVQQQQPLSTKDTYFGSSYRHSPTVRAQTWQPIASPPPPPTPMLARDIQPVVAVGHPYGDPYGGTAQVSFAPGPAYPYHMPEDGAGGRPSSRGPPAVSMQQQQRGGGGSLNNGYGGGYSPRAEVAPPRPPPPIDMAPPPPRPPPPAAVNDTDDEEYGIFWERVPLPRADQPILGAAHSLHQVISQWSSRENEIVGAAKRMAILMAKLSQLVRGEGGTKKDLIDCAKAIAEASEEVTRLAMQLAKQCTDKRMRSALLQVCERIPTIGTQLKILSTVKATMLGSQGSEEDQEAMELLVLNAQNLMQSVKDTVRAAEAASIKIRTDSGLRLRWVRKPAWHA